MGLMNSSLQIGRSAILSYQSALQTIGNNISSAGSPDYTRLTPQLDPLQGELIGRDLQPGAGVALTDIHRVIDEALEGRVRLAIGQQEGAAARQSALAQVESFYDDLSGAGLGSRLSEFWLLFDELQNTPEDPAIRDLVIGGGRQLAESFHTLRGQLGALGEDLDGQIEQLVNNADDLARQIAELNGEISTAEAGRRSQATSLRDQRDALIRKLSELMDVTVKEQPNGAVNVYVGSEALVQGADSRGLLAVHSIEGEFGRTSVRFEDTKQQVMLGGGKIAGLMQARDEDAYARIAGIDELAAAVIADLNHVHADGQGLSPFTEVTGEFDVLNAAAALDSAAAGLQTTVTSGGFYVTVLDTATQTPVAYRIEVTLDGTPPSTATDPSTGSTTLDSLVSAFNEQVEGVTASVTSDNRIAFAADTGYSFVFGFDGQAPRADSSGILAALGVNVFFSGTNAANIGVAETIANDPSLIAAASVLLPGDGVNAGRMASLATERSKTLEQGSLTELFQAASNATAVSAAGANADADASSSILSALQAQKESISGVNLDEEAVAMLKFQRAFQGSARFLTVVDELLGELVSLIR